MDRTIVEALQSEENLKRLINQVKDEMCESKSKREDIMKEIKRDIMSVLPNCKVHFFGSQVTSIATESSDVDIYIDHDCMSYDKALDPDLEHWKLTNWFGKFQLDPRFKVICYISNARVPILQMFHIGNSGTNIHCDISCQSGIAVEKSSLTRELLLSDFRVCWLVITVKWWMKSNNLLDKLKFTTYSTTWLVFFFLMQTQPNVLKPVSDMQQGCIPHIVGGWNCNFDRNFYPTKYQTRCNKDNQIKLLKKFFKFYGSFNFRNCILCPLSGTVVSKDDFDNLSLSSKFNDYVKLVRRGSGQTFDSDCCICIQDPFDLSHNITRVVRDADLIKFQNSCLESLRMPIFFQN